jgi:glycosyltransferase involved in cell wall biosynthesis
MSRNNNATPPLVSIALATFNGERFLREQLDSLVAQTYRPIEIVACDDASEDSTLSILGDYAARYFDVFRVYENQVRLGVVKNFEKAARLCRGAYVAFCDQDDCWHPEKLSILTRKIGRHSLVHSDAVIVDETGRVVSASFSKYAHKAVRETSFLYFLMGNTVTGCTSLIDRDLLDTAIPFYDGMLHDKWLALMASDARGIVYVDEALIKYRQHGGNASGSVIVPKPRGIKAKRLSVFMENRGAKYAELLQKYKVLYQACEKRLSTITRIQFRRWLAYHESFFVQRIRLKACLFHAAHIGVFARHKRLDKVLFDLAVSLLGDPTWKRGRPD